MKPLEYHPGTWTDVREAIDWYWDQSQLAALDFGDELKAALARLRESPQACLPYLYSTRRMLLDRFPFSVVFRERLHDIQIIAIAHARRHPGYWATRLKQ
jgi:plasmid stabilization system protein ParE